MFSFILLFGCFERSEFETKTNVFICTLHYGTFTGFVLLIYSPFSVHVLPIFGFKITRFEKSINKKQKMDHERIEYLQRSILYKEVCLHCNTHSLSCFVARQNHKSIIAEYCYCFNNPITTHQSYICMQCGTRKKTSGQIKTHISTQHMSGTDSTLCVFCKKILLRLIMWKNASSTSTIIFQLSSCWPVWPKKRSEKYQTRQ